jgi:hypothetical protein
VGLLDVLRGQRAPKRADLDAIFGIASAALTLDASLGLTTTGRAAVCFKSVEAAVFDDLVREIEDLLAATSSDSGTTVSRHDDSYGYSWVVIADPDIDDLATTTHVVSQSMEERSFSEQLLCTVFGFDGPPGALDLVYGYKRGAFYPVAQRGEGRRDNTFELRVKSVLEGELSVEPELERWYAVWDAPVREGAAG